MTVMANLQFVEALDQTEIYHWNLKFRKSYTVVTEITLRGQ